MRTLHIIGWKPDGTSALVSGPHVPIADQLRQFGGYKLSGKVPDGFDRVEMFDSEQGIVNRAANRPTPSSEPEPKAEPQPTATKPKKKS